MERRLDFIKRAVEPIQERLYGSCISSFKFNDRDLFIRKKTQKGLTGDGVVLSICGTKRIAEIYGSDYIYQERRIFQTSWIKGDSNWKVEIPLVSAAFRSLLDENAYDAFLLGFHNKDKNVAHYILEFDDSLFHQLFKVITVGSRVRTEIDLDVFSRETDPIYFAQETSKD